MASKLGLNLTRQRDGSVEVKDPTQAYRYIGTIRKNNQGKYAILIKGGGLHIRETETQALQLLKEHNE